MRTLVKLREVHLENCKSVTVVSGLEIIILILEKPNPNNLCLLELRHLRERPNKVLHLCIYKSTI